MNIKIFTGTEAGLLALGAVTTMRDFFHWYQGSFVVPWYRCTFPFLTAFFVIGFLYWRRKSSDD